MSGAVSAFYVAYTWGGYQARFFSAPSYKESQLSAALQNLFRKHEDQLDMPSAVGLRSGHRGFRRDLMWDDSRCMYLHTALLGVSEPGSSRPSSFLGFGVISDQPRLDGGHKMGMRLQFLLNDLAQRLCQGGHFRSDVDPRLAISQFITSNKAELGDLPRYSAQAPAPPGASRGTSRVYLANAGDKHATVFAAICDAGNSDGFFVFTNGTVDPQNLRSYGYEVTSWPLSNPPANEGALVRLGGAIERQNFNPTGVPGHLKALSETINDLKDRLNTLERQLDMAVSSQAGTNRDNNWVFVCFLFLLVGFGVLGFIFWDALSSHVKQHDSDEQAVVTVGSTAPDVETTPAGNVTGHDVDHGAPPAPSSQSREDAKPCMVEFKASTGIYIWLDHVLATKPDRDKLSLPEKRADALRIFVGALNARHKNYERFEVSVGTTFVQGDLVQVNLDALSNFDADSNGNNLTCDDVQPQK